MSNYAVGGIEDPAHTKYVYHITNNGHDYGPLRRFRRISTKRQLWQLADLGESISLVCTNSSSLDWGTAQSCNTSWMPSRNKEF